MPESIRCVGNSALLVVLRAADGAHLGVAVALEAGQAVAVEHVRAAEEHLRQVAQGRQQGGQVGSAQACLLVHACACYAAVRICMLYPPVALI